MSLLTAAAADEDGDTIRTLRTENEQLRTALLAMHDTLEMTATSGAFYARTAENLRDAVIRWANRAEQAEDMLKAIGAGGVGKLEQPHSKSVQTPVAYEFYNPTTGHAIVDYSEHTHVGHLIADKGYIANPLVRPQPPVVEQPQGDQDGLRASNEYMLGCLRDWSELAIRLRTRVAELESQAAAPTALEQPHVGKEPDWKDLYQKEKRRAEMWTAKYQQDIGKLERAAPVAEQPQVEQEPAGDDRQLQIGACITEGRLYASVMRTEPNGSVTVIAMSNMDAASLTNHDCIARMLPAQQPKRQPLTELQIDTLWKFQAEGLRKFARAIERAHGIGGEA